MKGVTLQMGGRGVSLRVFPAGGSPGPTLQTIRRGIVLQVRALSPGGRVVGRPLQPQFQLSAGPPSPFLRRRDEAAAESNPAAESSAGTSRPKPP
jgi:hypothetical protein